MTDHRDEIDAIVRTLTERRTRLGWSMRLVAEKSGVSPSCVHTWEHGTRAPSLSNLRAWALALGYELTLTSPEPTGEWSFREGECAPPLGCGCSCHRPGGLAVSHMVACCSGPVEGGGDRG